MNVLLIKQELRIQKDPQSRILKLNRNANLPRVKDEIFRVPGCEVQNPQPFRLGVAEVKPVLPPPDSYSLQTTNGTLIVHLGA